MSQLAVAGSPKEQASTESIAWQFDWTDRLAGQTISAASATVTQLDTGTDVSGTTLSGSVSFTSTSTTVTVHALTARKHYRVNVLTTFSGGSQQLASLELLVPY